MRTLCVACLFAIGCSSSGSPAGEPSLDDGGVAPSREDAGGTQPPSGTADPGATDAGGDLCGDGFPRGMAGAPRVVAALAPAPEGVAVCANGDVFVTIPDEAKILRVPLSGGDPEVWTTMPGRQPLGMTCVGNVLYVADFRSKDGAVMRVVAKDDPGTALPNIDGDKGYSALNAVVWVPGVGLFASDASNTPSGRIVRFAETAPGMFQASVAKSGLGFPNGLAFDPKSNALDVAFTVNSKVVSYPLEAAGALGSGTDAWSGTAVVDAVDGIARDENKALYVARYLKGFVTRSTDKANIAAVKSPKSLAFRGGTLLFTGEAGLHAVDLGVCGAQP